MRFFGEFKLLEIDVAGSEQAIDDVLEVATRQGANEWLTATVGRVPLWSGMARASLLSLAELVNGRIVLSPLKAKSRIPQGRALGTARVVTQRPAYFFEVDTQVPHYQIQDIANVGRSPTAPWRSFEAGQQAFQEYASTVRLPSVEYIEREIKVA